MTTTTTIDALTGLAGQELGTSEWFEVTQDRVNGFADATDDHQWIHVDVERATAESPFGGPVGHGYLTLALLIPMWSQVLAVTDATMAVNYGLNRVPVPGAGAGRLQGAARRDPRLGRGGRRRRAAHRRCGHRGGRREEAGVHRRADLPRLPLSGPVRVPVEDA